MKKNNEKTRFVLTADGIGLVCLFVCGGFVCDSFPLKIKNSANGTFLSSFGVLAVPLIICISHIKTGRALSFLSRADFVKNGKNCQLVAFFFPKTGKHPVKASWVVGEHIHFDAGDFGCVLSVSLF